jgi:biotin carboxyl carrier protein
MGTAKVVSLSVRPLQVSHLCFEIDGIIEASANNAQLGATAPAFDFPAFYAILASLPTPAGNAMGGSLPTAPADPSLLLYNAPEIEAAIAQFALVALRKEGRKAALNKAINARQNAYYAKYGHASAIVTQINDSYSLSTIGSKPYRLQVLSGIATDQWNLLKGAYTGDHRTGVVKTTNSVLDSTTESSGRSQDQGGSSETGGSNETGSTNADSVGSSNIPPGAIPALPPGGAALSPLGDGFKTVEGNPQMASSFQQGTSGETLTNYATTKTSDSSTNSGSAQEHQTITNTDYGYKTPYYEAAAQYERAQISLIDQQFEQFMLGQNLPNLLRVFKNELDSIDSDVYRLQIAYLNTFLMSPIAGTVTGVYKHPGDAVKAGEPVLRVENSATVLLVGTLIYRGPISIGSTVTVKTNLFDETAPQTTFPVPPNPPGKVVAVRGQRDDDKWDVIVQCDNLDGSGNPILPLGYHFDFDDTTVSIN